MQNAIPTMGTISWGRRLMPATAALGLLLVFGFAQPGLAQTNPLTLFKNYFVTGDYVVGGVGLRGLGDATGFATGTISIPDPNSVPATGVPPGADIVAAFLYWETVEKDKSTLAGKNGFFNGYAITGTILGNLTAPPSWSSGGCSGTSNGNNATTTMRAYRADVRPFLPVDANGKVQGNGPFQVKLADSGSNGGGTPLTLGASLVIIYRVQSPLVPLNSIVLYDGAFAPSNGSSTMSQPIAGFYQAAASPVAKITHIVGNGQPNKSESVLLNSVNLPSLYPGEPPFPGVYNQNTISLTGGGSWDNPTWFPNNYGPAVNASDAMETTSVVPNGSNSGCVDWGAVIFSTTVEDTNHDGLLAAWKAANPQGYTDVISNQFVALPGANPTAQDIFVEIDYMELCATTNADGTCKTVAHSHLPKQLALDLVGDAFWKQNIHVHFDVGTKYNGQTVCKLTPQLPNQQVCPDSYIIQGGTGGNAISESAVVCTDPATPTPTTLCQFPGQAPGQPGPPTVGWKEGFLFVKNTPPNPNSTPPVPLLGNFQFGRKDSYHYVLFGHALGTPRSIWSTFGANLQNASFAQLVSIVNSGTTATVKIRTPQGLVKPGDCPGTPVCSSDLSGDRVTVGGAIGHPALNGTYSPFTSVQCPDMDVTATCFTITTTGVADGTYNFSNEPRLAVGYAGPTSASGQSDFPGGADSAVMFGLWPADDVSGCQADPSVPLNSGQVYCNDQVGTITAEAGTLLHEMGHTFTLAHGGTFFPNGAITGQQTNSPPGVPTYGSNCSSGFLSSMNYLFQIRGFPDGGIDYSGLTLASLSELGLNETSGIGSDIFTGLPAAHFTRWYAPPNALDAQLQSTTGTRFATLHCDGTPILDGAQMVRVDGSTFTEPGGFSGPIDWNNDGNTTDTGLVQDINFRENFFNSPNVESPFAGFNDWLNVDLRQIGSRENALGFSGGAPLLAGGGGVPLLGGGGGVPLLGGGGGVPLLGGGGGVPLLGGGGGVPLLGGGGGAEQDVETACSTADPPTGLSAKNSNKTVVLNWTAPDGPCQVRRYDIWRATGSVTLANALANPKLFSKIGSISSPPTPVPLPTTFTDPNVKNNVTYTYFVTDTNKQGAQSGASAPTTILVKF